MATIYLQTLRLLSALLKIYNFRYKPEASLDERDWKTYNATANEKSYEFQGSRAYIPYVITLQTFNELGFAQDNPFKRTEYTGEDCKRHIFKFSIY